MIWVIFSPLLKAWVGVSVWWMRAFHSPGHNDWSIGGHIIQAYVIVLRCGLSWQTLDLVKAKERQKFSHLHDLSLHLEQCWYTVDNIYLLNEWKSHLMLILLHWLNVSLEWPGSHHVKNACLRGKWKWKKSKLKVGKREKQNTNDVTGALGRRYVEARGGGYLLVPRTNKFTYHLNKWELDFTRRILMSISPFYRVKTLPSLGFRME